MYKGVKAMLHKQEQLILSPHANLYNILVQEDHVLRRMKELIDFSFIYDELTKNYTVDFGRNAADPVYMFKLLLLKIMYPLSDRDLCERARYDMSFKYFLDIAPEDAIVHPSLLSKFRTQRLKNIDLLELLIGKSIEAAQEKNISLGNTIIVDATHTHSRFPFQSPLESLKKQTSFLRKSCYRIDESIKAIFLPKNTTNDIQEEITYTTKLLETIEKQGKLQRILDVKEKYNLAKEMIEDYNNQLTNSVSNDPDAKIGHKSADTSFFGFKSHIAMTENGWITGLVVTSGEQQDGKYLPELIKQSKQNGLDIRTIVGDATYSGKNNLEECARGSEPIQLIARLNPNVSKGTRKENDGLYFNKDSGMFVCPEGHQAIRKARTGKKNQNDNQLTTYYFDVEKCKSCPLEEICHKIGAKTKTYSVRIISDLHQDQIQFEQTDAFRERAKVRYRIEQKNSELKNRYGLKKSHSNGLLGMSLQSASTVFIANMRKIMRLMDEK